LISAAMNGHLAVVKELLDKEVDVDAVNELGMTPLMHAADKKHFGIVVTLVAAGADPAVLSKDGFVAADYSDRQDIKEFLNKYLQNLDNFLNDPTRSKLIKLEDRSTISEKEEALINHIYNGLLKPKYQDYLIGIGKSFIGDTKQQQFNKLLNELHEADKYSNFERFKIGSEIKKQLRMLEMAYREKLTDIKKKK